MENTYHERSTAGKPLRAIVEIDDGELRVYPIADSDLDHVEILDELRVYCGETEGRRER